MLFTPIQKLHNILYIRSIHITYKVWDPISKYYIGENLLDTIFNPPALQMEIETKIEEVYSVKFIVYKKNEVKVADEIRRTLLP